MDKKYIIIIAILIIISGIFASLMIYERLIVNKQIITPIVVDKVVYKVNRQVILVDKEMALVVVNCDAFLDMLTSCTKYRCQFIHPLTGETMGKEILGMIDGKCNYVEQIPNGGKMECKYTESFRKIIAQYYKDMEYAESIGFEANINLGSGEQITKYTIDGKEVANPLQEATDTGICVISGY